MKYVDTKNRGRPCLRVYFIGGTLALLSLVLVLGWMGHAPWLAAWDPGYGIAPYSAALGFLLVGSTLVAAGVRSRKITPNLAAAPSAKRGSPADALATVLPALVILLGLMLFVRWLAGVPTGYMPGPAAGRQWLVDASPYAGQTHLLSAAGFLAIGLAMGLQAWTAKPRSVVFAHALAVLAMFIGFLGVVGAIADFGQGLAWYGNPFFLIGLGFLAAGFALLSLLHQHSLYRLIWWGEDGDKIGLIAGAIILVTGLSGILGGFAVLYPETVGALEGNLALALQSRSDTLAAAIRQAWLDSHSFANQPLRLETMRRLAANPGDTRLRLEIRKVAERFAAFGFSGVVFRDAGGAEVARAGTFVAKPQLAVAVGTPTPSTLLWNGGFVLHAHADMVSGGRVVGSLEAERQLDVGPELHDTAHLGSSLDFAVCAPAGRASMNCFPFRSTGGKVLRDLPNRFQGRPIPAAHALAGQTGIIHTRDYRGTPVIAAYQPIGSLGLGAVLKIDADQLYSPIVYRLKPLLGVMLILSAVAVAMLRLQVLPLTHKLTGEIQERKKVETELEFARAELAEITDTLGEGVYVLDERGLVTFVNPEAERLLGWTAEELMGRNGHDLFHSRRPDGTPVSSADCPVHRTIATGQQYRALNDWFVRKDGSFVPVSIVSSPIVRAGAVRGAVASFYDVTQRLAQENALRESEARFRATFENAPIGMGIVAMDGCFLDANRALCDLLGYMPGELRGLDLDAISHPDDRAASGALLQKAREGDFDSYKVEKRYLRKDGGIVWVQVTVSIVRDGNGLPEYSIGQVEDISERKKHDEALRESEERFRLISTAATDGIVTMNPDGNIGYWNPAAAKMFGYGGSEAIGRPLHELLAPSRVLADFQRGFEQFRVSGTGPLIGKTFETAALHRNGQEFPVELSISALRIKDEWHALGVIRDISERKQTEEQIRHLAYYDYLTDLPNRRLFIDRLNQGLVQARRFRRALAVLYLDLDRFKTINDTLGHDVGDRLLVSVAERLRDCVRSSDTVSRLGGDEFAIILVEIAQPMDAAVVAEKVIERLQIPIQLDDQTIKASTSIGIAIYPIDGTDDGRMLIKKADMALYEAKAAGRNRYAFAAGVAPG